ncbi:MAG: hypothetical protein WCF85_06055 [Rhodospirillaceae bacterium]
MKRVAAALLALLVLALISGAASIEGRAAPAVAAESTAPGALRPDGSALVKRPPFIDRNVVFLTCATGASLGALVTGMPPVISWIPYSGWPTQLSSLALRMGLGCYYGTLAGVAASGTYSLARMLREFWNSLF